MPKPNTTHRLLLDDSALANQICQRIAKQSRLFREFESRRAQVFVRLLVCRRKIRNGEHIVLFRIDLLSGCYDRRQIATLERAVNDEVIEWHDVPHVPQQKMSLRRISRTRPKLRNAKSAPVAFFILFQELLHFGFRELPVRCGNGLIDNFRNLVFPDFHLRGDIGCGFDCVAVNENLLPFPLDGRLQVCVDSEFEAAELVAVALHADQHVVPIGHWLFES